MTDEAYRRGRAGMIGVACGLNWFAFGWAGALGLFLLAVLIRRED